MKFFKLKILMNLNVMVGIDYWRDQVLQITKSNKTLEYIFKYWLEMKKTEVLLLLRNKGREGKLNI